MRRNSDTPSLGQIAAEAAVSRAAVSMALRNHPRIPEATRKRIQAIANRLGWKPNPLLAEAMSAIRAGQPPLDRVTLAWVTTRIRRDGWQDSPFDLRCFHGASERAENAGYRLEHFWVGDANGNAHRLSEILYNRGITGVLLAPLRDLSRFELNWDHFASATVAHTLIEPNLHRANDNHISGSRVCVARLHGAGRRRIGLAIDERLDNRVEGLWTAGYLLETLEEGLADPALLHRPNGIHETEFLRWVKTTKPDAIIGTNPSITEWLTRAGYKVPEDIAYVSLDLATNDGSIAGIYQDAHAIGAAAIDMIAGQLLRHERGVPSIPKNTIINGRWIDGATALKSPPDSEYIRKAEMLLAHSGTVAPTRPVLFD
jgi:LacI family transcriptional regulator